MSRKLLFVDRDGCLIEEPVDGQIDSYGKLNLLPEVMAALQRLVGGGYELVMVSNQDGLGTASFPEADFAGPHALLLRVLASQGIAFAEVLKDARGFIYHITLTGTTGAASATAADVEAAIARLRRHSRLPVAAGFGIRSAAQVHALAGKAELIVVGSRLVEVLAHNGVEAALEEVRAFAAACHPQP